MLDEILEYLRRGEGPRIGSLSASGGKNRYEFANWDIVVECAVHECQAFREKDPDRFIVVDECFDRLLGYITDNIRPAVRDQDVFILGPDEGEVPEYAKDDRGNVVFSEYPFFCIVLLDLLFRHVPPKSWTTSPSAAAANEGYAIPPHLTAQERQIVQALLQALETLDAGRNLRETELDAYVALSAARAADMAEGPAPELPRITVNVIHVHLPPRAPEQPPVAPGPVQVPWYRAIVRSAWFWILVGPLLVSAGVAAVQYVAEATGHNLVAGGAEQPIRDEMWRLLWEANERLWVRGQIVAFTREAIMPVVRGMLLQAGRAVEGVPDIRLLRTFNEVFSIHV